MCIRDRALTLAAVEAKFGGLLPRMKWLNFGGGHHITRPGYRLATLEQCITAVSYTHLDVYKRQDHQQLVVANVVLIAGIVLGSIAGVTAKVVGVGILTFHQFLLGVGQGLSLIHI